MQRKTDTRLATAVAAFASLGAAAIHLAVVPDHWREWPLSGLFFAVLALGQLGWAVAVLLAPHRVLLGVGIAANLGALALWAVTRTWGLPFGPHTGEPEALGTAGLLTTLLEVTVVTAAAWAMLRQEHPSGLSPWVYRVALGGAAVVTAAIMAPGVVAGLDHTHDSGGHGPADHHGPADQHGTPGHSEPPAVPAPASDVPRTQAPQPPEHSELHGHPDDHAH